MNASKLAIAAAEAVVAELYQSQCASMAQVRFNAKKAAAAAIDNRLAEIRKVYEPEELAACPYVTHHPPGPCAFCNTAAMRAFILLTEEL